MNLFGPALPVLIPLVTAFVLLPLRGRRTWEKHLTLVSAILLVVVGAWLMSVTARGETLVLPVGDWPAAVGIVWVVDRLAAVMVLLGAIASLAVTVYAPAALRRGESRWFFVLHQFVMMGVNGSFVTGDLFNLFVFFEVMLVSSFVLIALGGRRHQLRESFSYVVINLVASSLLFAGVGVIYASAGTVNMAQLAERVAAGGLPTAFWGGLVTVLMVFGIKAAVLPLFFWLPDSYPQAPLPVSAFFAGILTKVGVYTLFRGLTLFSGPEGGPLHQVLLVVSAGTMLVGVLGALGRNTVRGILSFHIISQVGYMVFGLAIFSPAGVAAGLFYIIHHIIVKTALFLVGGFVERVTGGGELGRGQGIARVHPWAGVAFFLPAMALAGLPPLSGFWGKLFLIKAGFQAGVYVTTGIAVLVSLLTLASMLKIWFGSFWGAPRNLVDLPRSGRLIGAPLGLAALSVLIGLASPALWSYSASAARDLLDPGVYIEAVRLGAPSRPLPEQGGS